MTWILVWREYRQQKREQHRVSDTPCAWLACRSVALPAPSAGPFHQLGRELEGVRGNGALCAVSKRRTARSIRPWDAILSQLAADTEESDPPPFLFLVRAYSLDHAPDRPKFRPTLPRTVHRGTEGQPKHNSTPNNPGGGELAHREPEQSVGCTLVLDPGDSGDGEAARVERGAAPPGQPSLQRDVSGLRPQRALHHVSVVERAQVPAHPQRAPVLPDSPASGPHRRVQYAHGSGASSLLLSCRPHEDHARVHDAGVHRKGCAGISPIQLPQIRTPR